MAKINDIKELDPKLLKGDTFNIYKAYFFDNTKSEEEDYAMKLNENVDMFGITKEAAIHELLRSIPTEAFLAQLKSEFDELSGIDPDREWLYRNMVVNVEGKAKGNDLCVVEMTDIVVPILTISLDLEDLKDKELIEDAEEPVFHDDVIGITLSDKKFDIYCSMTQLLSFKLIINADGGREITDIKTEEIEQPHKKEN